MTLALRPTVLLTETEYGMALLDQRDGVYWTLNPTAAHVLSCLLEGRSPGETARALTGEYDVSTDVAEKDVARIVDELRSAQLVTVAGEEGVEDVEGVEGEDA
ncbi:lasso peptide biosynthesis PqqD family chaperone [Streptomyces sp. G45]|uniref:lasso peptide biosynthesis PqqD family chaperone n=1 Tax=Streptomyces sp. G45 TaxID=3406627 RepID=UPI003C19068B